MNPRCFVRIAGAGLIALIVYGCETLPEGPFPRATEVGWWHGEDASGTQFEGARMPYAMFFRGGYAMHQGYVPPFAASHGCIRLPGQMAVRFFENAPVGTPVTVKE